MALFIDHNENSKGMSQDDCLVRATTTFLQITYQQAGYLIARSQGESGFFYNTRGNSTHLFEKMLGLEPKEYDGTVNSLANKINESAIVFVKGHAVYIEPKKYFDTWDSGRRRVQKYYTIPRATLMKTKQLMEHLEQYNIF